jgi:pseudouridine synthase
MKLQKYLSQQWVASRRHAEELISLGRISVNGVKAHIGQVIDPEVDRVELDDAVIKEQLAYVYYAFNKPRDIVSTCVSRGETGIMDIINLPTRVFPIGRLDKETTGLILLTNDGRMAHRLMHPSFSHEKEYLVEIFGPIDDDEIDKLSRGVDLGDVVTRSCIVERVASGKFRIILKEGKNRQIRRMVETLGKQVKKLKRIRIEHINLGTLQEWELRPLTKSEKEHLLAKTGLQSGDNVWTSGEDIHNLFDDKAL